MQSPHMMFGTNVLVDARDNAAAEKKRLAANWIRQAVENGSFSLPTHVVGEFVNMLCKKERHLGFDEHLAEIAGIERFVIGSTPLDLLVDAVELPHRTGFQWWDCVILANAIKAGCRYLISEDYQHRRLINGVTIINPFIDSFDDVVAAHGKH